MKRLFYSMKIFSPENTILNKAFTIKKSTCAQRVEIIEKNCSVFFDNSHI